VAEGGPGGTPLATYARGVRASLGNNASAYAYSVMITASFGVLTSVLGPSGVGDVFVFGLGAATGFTLTEAVASRGFRVRMRGEPSDVVVLGGAMSYPSILFAVGAAAVAAFLLGPAWGWLGGSFVGTCLFLLLGGIEVLLGERMRRARGVEEQGGVNPRRPGRARRSRGRGDYRYEVSRS
jgi:hypothetical protein